MLRSTRRTASAVLAVGTTLALTAPPALAAPTTTDPAQAAAGWLAHQLVDGERIETTFGDDTYPDHGLTADVIFALAGAGVAAGEIAAATDWLESQVDSYTGVAWGDVYAGSVGKLLVVAATTGRDATSFGGADLVELLEAREQESGRYSDQTQGDWSNVITQSLGVLGLHRTAGVEPSADAVSYLAAQACDDGGFPSQLEPETCTSNVDATGFAVQALLPLIGTDATLSATTDAAVSWLLDEQAAEGSFGGPDSPANSNSTGLAAAALAAAGETDAAEEARSFIVGLQAGCDDEEPGSIAFDADDPGDRTRAGAQAVVGLVDAGLSDVSASGASSEVPLLDCPDDEPAAPSPDPAGDEPLPAPDEEEQVEVETEVDEEEPREGTEAAPGEMPRTGPQALWLALLGAAALTAGVTTLRRTTTR